MCTKFNVGDAVWAFDVVANEPLRFVVNSITIEEEEVYYTLDTDDVLGFYPENVVFQSKEDCIVYYMRLFRTMSME
jgi:hypothetical protein